MCLAAFSKIENQNNMTYLVCLLIFGYAFVILLLSKEALAYRNTRTDKRLPQLPFTIIVNYRNEESNLPHQLESIERLNYLRQNFQLVFVNDDSTDSSQMILKHFKKEHPEIHIQLLDRKAQSASAKKDGITQALEGETQEHIIITDADCQLPEDWLHSYNTKYHEQPDSHFIAGPLEIATQNSVLGRLQASEMIALQVAGIGSFSYRQPFLCNGANMSFTKNAFLEVNGYQGNDHISSGDDIFLLEKLSAEDVMKCHYLKSREAIVTTAPKTTWMQMVAQRARWAQKGSKTKSLLNKLVSFQVLFMNVLLLISPVLLLLDLISQKLWVAVILVKFFTDFIALLVGRQLFENENWAKSFFISFLLYPFAVVHIAIKSLRSNTWKGRAASLE
jgi:biofilm PGA synthesis N-glycosyltransferase PgaC